MDEPWRLPAEVMCRVQREKTWYSGQRGCMLSPCQGQNGNPGQDVNGKSLSGTITVIQETPNLIFTHHQVDDTGALEFTANSTGQLLLHARAPQHPTAEHVIPAGTGGPVTVNFALPLGQNVKVRVVDSAGNGVPGAALRVRYDEPEKPTRRVAFETDDLTDGDGYLLLQNVGIQVPFVVDVLAPNYPPASSKLTKLNAGAAQMQDIALGQPGATVVVGLNDKAGNPVSGAGVMLLADPAGLPAESRGSWLHQRAFRQRAATSSLGNVRFTGVPPGHIIVRVKTASDTIEHRGTAVSNQELQVSLVLP